jgi:hypothetical protein
MNFIAESCSDVSVLGVEGNGSSGKASVDLELLKIANFEKLFKKFLFSQNQRKTVYVSPH